MSKKLYFAAFVAALAIIGCSEKNVGPAAGVEGGEKVKLTVNLPDLASKAVGEPSDAAVNDVQIFVFDKYGVYETSGTASGASVSLTCTTGEKHLVALVNAPQEPVAGTITELRQRRSDLKDCSVGSLVMSGETSVVLKASGSVNMSVTRLASRVKLLDVKPDFQLPQHQQLSFEVTAVYMINVAGDRAYLAEGDPTKWYNEAVYDASTSPSFLYDAVSDGAVQPGATYSADHYFYCYPNATATDTRLVVEAKVGGNTYYYPVTLDMLEQNHSYSCTLTVTRLGSDDPDVPVEDGAMNFTVEVDEWVETSVSETI